MANDHGTLVITLGTVYLRGEVVQSLNDLLGLLRRLGQSPQQFAAAAGIIGLRPQESVRHREQNLAARELDLPMRVLCVLKQSHGVATVLQLGPARCGIKANEARVARLAVTHGPPPRIEDAGAGERQ